MAYKWMLEEPCPYALLNPCILELFNPRSASALASSWGNGRAESTRDALDDGPTGPLFPNLSAFSVRQVKEPLDNNESEQSKLQESEGQEFNDGDLVKFLRHRLQHHLRSVTRITYVSVGFVSKKTVDVLGELQGMVDVSLDGVEIELRYDEESHWADL